MKVGISTACFYPDVNTEDTLDIIKDYGFDICEVFLEAQCEMEEKYCEKLREKAEKLNLEIYSVFMPLTETLNLFYLIDMKEEDLKWRINLERFVMQQASWELNIILFME